MGAATAAQSARISANERASAQLRGMGAASAARPSSPGASPTAQLQPWQRAQLYQQIGGDVIPGLLTGQSAYMVLLQQGPQIAQIYGGVGNTLRAVAAAITPVRLGMAGAATTVIAGGMALDDYLQSTKEVQIASVGLGRALGAAPAQLERIATTAAATGEISVREARSMEAAFLRTGRVGVSNFEGLIGISKDFAATVGTDLSGAQSQLAKLFADPSSGAAQLQQIGLLDGATARLVQRLAQQNRLSEAQSTMLNAIKPRLVDAAEATTAWGRAWDYLSRSASNAWDSIGKGIDSALGGSSDTLESRLSDAQQRLQAVYTRARRLGVQNPAGADVIRAEIDDINEQMRRRSAQNSRRVDDASLDRAGTLAIDVAANSSANDTARRRLQLQQDIASLRAGQSATGQTAEQQEQIARAIEAKTRALDGLNRAQDIQNQLVQIDAQISAARDPVTRANLIRQREATALLMEEVDATKAAEAADRARTRALEEGLASYEQRIADLKEETEARRRVNDAVASGAVSLGDANRQMQFEAQIRPLVVAAMKAEGAERARLLDLINQSREAYAAAASQESRSAALSIQRDQNDRLDQLRLEISLVGQTEEVRARRLAQLEAEQRITAAGVGQNSREAAEIRAKAAAIADLTVVQARAQDAWDRYREAGESALDAIGDALNGQSVEWSNVLQSISRELIQLSVVNPLKNSIFGTNYGTLGDLTKVLSGSNDNVPSAGRAVGAMQVTAGTVIVNGPFSGALGSAAGLSGGGGIGSDAVASQRANTAAVGRGGIGSDYAATTDVAKYIEKAAVARGIDPKVALAVAKSEGGLNSWNLQSRVMKNGVQEPSFGPYQLYMGGGLGNEFQKQTGLDPRLAANGPAGVDFALDHASKNGWGAWYGAKKAGIGNMDGIGTAGVEQQAQTLSSAMDTATQGVNQFGTGIGDLSRTAFDASGGLTTSAGQLTQASQTVATSATSFTGGLAGAFGQILGGIGQIGTGFIQGFGGVLQSLLGGLTGGGGSLLSGIAGIFGFANGGVMTASGPLPLRTYANGGIANSPQVAIYGEGRRPEAYVPLPDGRRIPVALSGGMAGTNDNLPEAAAALRDAAANIARGTIGGGRGKVEVNLHGAPGAPRVEENVDDRGNRRIDLFFDDQNSRNLARPGSRSRQALAATTGVLRR
ncbi:phage tail length tape measure family protein [Ancylobacter sp. 3268]|uniref:phage tail length tape measure family protein n=1 Tax=Ancylobacter sp. 3268 TaxID=2817752 RepID=UPI00385784E8